MTWFKRKQVCTHCNENRTKREFEGAPTCGACEVKILMGRESIHRCPIDNVGMKKEHHEDIIIDRCPKCSGVWLDAGELDAMKKAMQSGDSDFATGLIVGLAVG